MIYDGFTLAAVTAEIKRILIGGKIQKIRQHNDTDITLEIRGPGHTYMLFFSVDARFPRVYLTASIQPVPQEPPNFCMLMRKYASGAYIVDIEQAGLDRVLKIKIEYPDHTRYYLIFELMGKHSNLILVDENNKILGAAKNIGASVSRYRQVLPGRDYMPPPGNDKIDPRTVDAATFDRLWDAASRQLADNAAYQKWVMSTFSGIGPFLADEIIARSSEDSGVSQDKVREEILQLGDMIRNSTYEPVFITGERGEGLMVYPMPSLQFPATQQHPRASINEALDALFRTLVTRSVLEDEKTQTLTAIRRAMAARTQSLKSIDRTVAESKNAEKYKQIGELILGNLHAIEKGAKSVKLVDYFDSEMPEIDIELDEKLTPQQNSERYFKRFQKARDSVYVAENRRARTVRELDLLEAARTEVEGAKSVEAIKDLRKMLLEQELLRQEIIQEKQAEEFGGERIRRFFTPEGWEILYGENSKANDYLTQRVARPNDLWLHARSITGAHVVVRTAGHKGGVPRPILTQAAKIAAQNSDAKHSSLVPIDYTYRKYVRKPRSSAPGFVTYRNEKTIDINPKV